MEYNDKVFDQIAVPRIKKFYDYNKDAFLARAMDYKDLLQEMRIAVWQKTQKYADLAQEEYAKLINKILSTKLIDAKQLGYRHMKTENMTIEENDETIVIKGHQPQFLDIDSIKESELSNKQEAQKLRAKITVEMIKAKLNPQRQEVLELIMDGSTDDEIACKQICCQHRASCEISINPQDYMSVEGNISKKFYKAVCRQYNKLNKQSIQFNRLKKQVIEKIKKIAK